MEKHFITAMLVLVLLAPQTGLEAKSRHHGVKERDYAAEKHDYEKKKDGKHRHYSRYKKHKKHRHSHSIRDELESINKAIADIRTEIAALGQPGGGLPGDLTAILEALEALQSEIDLNTGELVVVDSNITNIILDIQGINDSLIANGRVRLAGLESAVTTLDSELAALISTVDTLSGGTPTDLVFSGNFIEGEEARFSIKSNWDSFINNATGSFASIEIRNSVVVNSVTFEGSVVCADPATATLIINELNTHVPVPGPTLGSEGSIKSFTCNEPITLRPVIWNIGECGREVELNADLTMEAVCGTGEGAVVRPLHNSKSWGGVGLNFGGSGGTSGAPSQTLQVILTR